MPASRGSAFIAASVTGVCSARTGATMTAEKHNQILFKVLRDATKPEIKAAVQLLFKVEVESVQTVVQKGKAKRFGRSMGRRDHVKKAYVSLKAGQELNFTGEAA